MPDPADGRGRLLRFPNAAGLLDGLGELRALELELRAVVGEADTEAVSAWLSAVEGWLDAGGR